MIGKMGGRKLHGECEEGYGENYRTTRVMIQIAER